jgi:hypothetical protein
MTKHLHRLKIVLLALAFFAAPAFPAAAADSPVKVFILMGQSNMVGAGKVKGDKPGTLEHAVEKENLYDFLIDDEGNWKPLDDQLRYVRFMSGRELVNDWMKVSGGKIGPEFGIGEQLSEAIDGRVMVLKSCIGNRSLGWDLLPPGSKSYEFTDPKDGKTYVYAGYKQSPLRWEKGTEPEPIGWYAGKQWDTDVGDAKKVLDDFAKYYPGAEDYEVAGFFFWQGDKDRYNAAHAGRYEQNLVHFIKQLRKDFDAPNAKFVCATLGQSEKGSATGNDKLILEAQLAVDGDSGKYPEFKGNVATVYTNPLSMGGASNGHYGGNAETYMNVGEAMGRAMVELLKN